MNYIETPVTVETPAVKFYPDRGYIEITGRSTSENATKFYRPLIEGIEKYLFKPVSPTLVHIQFEYFNTATAKCIMELLKKLESLPKKGIKVEVNWYYKTDEQAMYHAGMDYKSILNVDFKLVKY
jgi:response regulator RpfG family c-di-GMP phosphodiesterase